MLNHKHYILNATANNILNNPLYTEESINSILLQIVSLVNMKVFLGPYVKRCYTDGNEGITGAVVIETSHCSVHIWDTGEFRFDLYSCSDFVEDDVCKFLTDTFDLTDHVEWVLDRNDS